CGPYWSTANGKTRREEPSKTLAARQALSRRPHLPTSTTTLHAIWTGRCLKGCSASALSATGKTSSSQVQPGAEKAIWPSAWESGHANLGTGHFTITLPGSLTQSGWRNWRGHITNCSRGWKKLRYSSWTTLA